MTEPPRASASRSRPSPGRRRSRRRPGSRSPTTQLRRNLRRATTTIRTKRSRAVAERPDWEDLRLAGAAIKDDVLARLPELLDQLEANVTAAGGDRPLGPRRRRGKRDRGRHRARGRAPTEVVKVKSMATQEIELNEALAQAGIDAWETDLAELIVQLGHDLPSHILVPGDPPQPRRDPGHLPGARWARAGRPAPADLTDEPRDARRGRPAPPAREVPAGQGGDLGRELRRRRDRHRDGRRVRGQRPDVPDPARDPDHGDGHREARAHLARPRGLPAAAAALVDGRADEPVHLDVDRGDAGRRAAGVPPGPARQRPHRRRSRDDVGRQALRCIKCSRLPQRLPGLRADRRPGLRLAVPGPDRRDPDAAAARHRPPPGRRADRLAAVRLVAVRGVLRGLPGPDRHPRGPRPPAHPGRPPARLAGADVRRGAGRDAGRCRPALREPAPARTRPSGWPALAAVSSGERGRIGRLPLPGLLGAWFRRRDLPAPARTSFRRWWRKRPGTGGAP